MSTPSINQLGPIDIQMGPQYDQQKLNQLIQQLQVVENAVNQLVSAVNALQNNPVDTVPKHELAGTDGLGPAHTVSGLTAGQVLAAVSANVAEFVQLKLQQLAGMASSVAEPDQDDVLTFVNGYWTPKPAPGGEVNQSYLTANNETAALPMSRQLVAGANISFDLGTVGKLTIIGVPTGGNGPETFVLTGNGASLAPTFQFPQDSFYTTYGGSA